MPMIEIARFHTPVEADLARARLDAAGIDVLLLDHNLSSAFGGAMMPSRVMVREVDEKEARALLAG